MQVHWLSSPPIWKKRRKWPGSFGHLTAAKAAYLAREAGVKTLILTHLSRRYRERDIRSEARSIFPNTYVARDLGPFSDNARWSQTPEEELSVSMEIQRADVIICGAGIAGVAAAYTLAVHHGIHDVLLVDERAPLTLTSDKSSEGYRNWWPGPGGGHGSTDGSQHRFAGSVGRRDGETVFI